LISRASGLKLLTKRQAAAELIVAGGLWGFGFVATQWALTTWSPAGVLMWRFLGALVLGEILHLIFSYSQKTKSPWKDDFKIAIPAGLFLGIFLLLQTIGLQYTTATKSGFITTLYVIFVPFANWVLFKKKISAWMWVMVVTACAGTVMLMDIRLASFAEDINKGDVWTLLSAIFATCHIIYIGRISHKVQFPFRVNNFQSLWALSLVIPALVFFPKTQIGPLNEKAFWGVVILAAACSVLAFFVQVRAQKVLSDTTASVLFLLESPYAFFFAYILLGDRLSMAQSLGATLILGAALGMVALENGSTSKEQSK
jgi:drug/metabolite transporter (DMT)-like permease